MFNLNTIINILVPAVMLFSFSNSYADIYPAYERNLGTKHIPGDCENEKNLWLNEQQDGEVGLTLNYYHTIKYSQSSYSSISPENGWFQMISQKTIIDNQVVGEGLLKTHNYFQLNSESTQVLGVDIAGHARIYISPGDDIHSSMITFDSMYEEGDRHVVVRTPGRFVIGDWDVYESGGFVKIELLRDRQQNFVRDLYTKVLEHLGRLVSYDNIVSDLTISAPRVDYINIHGPDTLEGSTSSGFNRASPEIAIKGHLLVDVN